MTPLDSMYAVIADHAVRAPEAPAIGAPGRTFLSYRELLRRIDETIVALNHFGIGRGDWVATALPNGPEAAVSLVAIGAGAVVTPLNPGSSRSEFEVALTQAEYKALVLVRGTISPARDVAMVLGIPIIDLHIQPSQPAGTYRLTGMSEATPIKSGHNEPGELALILRSSGTTAQPKLIPFRQNDIVAHADDNVRIVHEISAADRCLCLTPFFHGHGASTGVMANLFAGASVVCPPGLILPDFFQWMNECQPTWYTGIPSMHQAILDSAKRQPEVIAQHSLRFARSAAAPLPETLRDAWEEIFRIPLIDAIGSTETPPFGRTPFPPMPRKAGSIGVVLPAVAIVDERGEILPAGKVGEISVPADRVCRPIGTTDADFPVANGRYRTGDLAYVDDEGYLFLMGRVKEVINRGGEKIAPREVEDAILTHPAVAEVAVFPIADPRLGQDVAAVIVPREGMTVTVDELRGFVASQLARFKVPRVVVIADRIPVSSVGKIQRNQLAEVLGFEANAWWLGESLLSPAPRVADSVNAELPSELGKLNGQGTADTFHEIVRRHARAAPDSHAIGAPGRSFMTYADLVRQIDETVAALNRGGIGRGDWVATILSNGPEAVAATVAIGSGAAVAPLSPALTRSEYEVALDPSEVKALVVPAGIGSPARDVAVERGIPIFEIEADLAAPAGIFRLIGPSASAPARPGLARTDDYCLIFRSAGTTARPKLIPYRQSDMILRSTETVNDIVRLTADDRCLCLAPYFHSHGVCTGIYAHLNAGACILAVPGLTFPEFFQWLDELRPTWYTALPSMHQAILDQAASHPDVIARHSLRFARSYGAPMPRALRDAWEAVFGVILGDTLGSTETRPFAHTPFPPIPSRAGSVGLARPIVAIVDELGQTVRAGTIGEIAVPAEQVIRPIGGANEDFVVVNGRYRTGDLAFVDEEGYLFVVGRVKEVINRGGEKIAPREIEDAILTYSSVAEVAVFPIADSKLGHDVAAIVVPEPGRTVTGDELRGFVASRLARFKIPRLVIIADRIPVGPTGKIQRNQLAEALGLNDQPPGDLAAPSKPARHGEVAPRDDLERKLCSLWEALLEVQPIGVTDDFFALGGDSMASLRLLTTLDGEFGVKLSEAVLSGVSTVEGLAKLMRDATLLPDRATVIPLKASGTRPPLFICLHGDLISVVSYRQILQNLDEDQPVLGIRLPEGKLSRGAYRGFDEVSAVCVELIRSVQRNGPYHILGHSVAGIVAFEVGRQLAAAGEFVAFVGLIDSACPAVAERERDRWWRHLVSLAELAPTAMIPYLAERVSGTITRARRRIRTWSRVIRGAVDQSIGSPDAAAESLTSYVLAPYVPRSYPGKVTLFLARDRPANLSVISQLGWKQFAAGGFDVREIPGDHVSLLRSDRGAPLGLALQESLEEAQR